MSNDVFFRAFYFCNVLDLYPRVGVGGFVISLFPKKQTRTQVTGLQEPTWRYREREDDCQGALRRPRVPNNDDHTANKNEHLLSAGYPSKQDTCLNSPMAWTS